MVAVLAFKFSPWPVVAIITYAFSRSAKASAAALEKHVPAGIVTRPNIAYGRAKAEVFDLFYQEGTNAPRPTIGWAHGGGCVAGSKNGIAKLHESPRWTWLHHGRG
jgi:acetyl esterase